METLETAVIIMGLLLMGGAMISGLAARSFISLTALFVLCGFALGQGGAGVIDFTNHLHFVEELAIVALIVLLFRDGLEVEAEMLRDAWHLPLRKLILALPITAVVVAIASKYAVGLSWTEAALLGALLSPTDPILASGVINNPKVPRLVRHSLNLESGLNDGLALPAILAFTAALSSSASAQDFVWWQFVLQDITLGVLFGIILGYVGALLMPRDLSIGSEIPAHAKSLYVLGVALSTFGLAATEPFQGNGFIAVFVCAIVVGIKRPDLREYFIQRADDIIELIKLGVFVVFGSLLTFKGLSSNGVGGIVVVLVTLLLARPIALTISLAGTDINRSTKAFMAWFGPKGIATMAFSLLVLSKGIPAGQQLFNLTALVVFCSIIVHSLTDTPGGNWIAKRSIYRPGREPSDG